MEIRVEFDEPVYGNNLEKALKESAEEFGLRATTKEDSLSVYQIYPAEDNRDSGCFLSRYLGTNMKLWKGMIPMIYINGINLLREQSSFSIKTGLDSPFPFYGFASDELAKEYVIRVHSKLMLQEVKKKRPVKV